MATERARPRANIGSNMEEMGARAKTTPLKTGQKYQSRGQGQGKKLMTKYGGNGGKGKNDTLKLR